MSEHKNSAGADSDKLLWIAAAAVAAIAVSWGIVWQLGTGTSDAKLADLAGDVAPLATDAATADAATAAAADGNDETPKPGLDNPLRAAELAYAAGMLTEPENYSAWTLFGNALAGDPASTEARSGLERVAADLLVRATAAIEQGRYDDALAVAELIAARLPEHAGAGALRQRIDDERARQAARERQRAAADSVSVDRPTVTAGGSVTAPSVEPSTSRRDPGGLTSADRLAGLHMEFEAAVASNRLLAPADDNARHYLLEMRAIDSNDAQTIADADWLTTEMLSRSRQATEATDWTAAETWISEAEALGADTRAVAEARRSLTGGMIAAESAKRLPASELNVVSYVAPAYPRTAASRGIEGWVDVDFRVTAAGRTTDVTVADASHTRLFQPEAIEAVSAWIFEPRMFLGQPIDQNVYTRVRFVFSE